MAKANKDVLEAGQAFLDHLAITKVDASRLPQLTRKGESLMPSNEYQKILDEIKKLEGRKQEAIKQLVAERDAKVKEYNDALAELGYKDEDEEPEPTAVKEKRQRKAPEGPCPICNFATEPAHDGRKHRQQNPKGPFTAAELAKFGLKKVG